MRLSLVWASSLSFESWSDYDGTASSTTTRFLATTDSLKYLVCFVFLCSYDTHSPSPHHLLNVCCLAHPAILSMAMSQMRLSQLSPLRAPTIFDLISITDWLGDQWILVKSEDVSTALLGRDKLCILSYPMTVVGRRFNCFSFTGSV